MVAKWAAPWKRHRVQAERRVWRAAVEDIYRAQGRWVSQDGDQAAKRR
jgi:hypothetical protein